MFYSRCKSLLLFWFTFLITNFFTEVKAAEKIKIIYSPLEFSISIESLELLAEEGKITGNLKQFSSFFDEQQLQTIGNFLGKSYNFNQPNLYKVTRTSLAQDLLTQLGKVVSTHPNHNGFLCPSRCYFNRRREKRYLDND